MDWLQILILSLVQGLTEFLPVSSSAHLILIPELLGWQDQGLSFDIAVHLGTLLAVIAYFRTDLLKMLKGFFRSLQGKKMDRPAKIFWFIGFATIPVGLVGLLIKGYVETTLRSPLIIAFSTIGFGLLLWIADKFGKRRRSEKLLDWKDALVIGCAQAISLIPGTSRSGITLTAGLFRHLTREAAARFSFLLSIPVIILASGLEVLTLIKHPTPVDWIALAFAISMSALSGFICIHYFLRLLNKFGLLPFVIYRLILGAFLIVYFY